MSADAVLRHGTGRRAARQGEARWCRQEGWRGGHRLREHPRAAALSRSAVAAHHTLWLPAAPGSTFSRAGVHNLGDSRSANWTASAPRETILLEAIGAWAL